MPCQAAPRCKAPVSCLRSGRPLDHLILCSSAAECQYPQAIIKLYLRCIRDEWYLVHRHADSYPQISASVRAPPQLEVACALVSVPRERASGNAGNALQ